MATNSAIQFIITKSKYIKLLSVLQNSPLQFQSRGEYPQRIFAVFVMLATVMVSLLFSQDVDFFLLHHIWSQDEIGESPQISLLQRPFL